MTRLQSELQRLYSLPALSGPQTIAGELPLVSPDGQVRAMVLALARPATWEAMGKVWRGVQAELELPAPAIAVNGVDGYQLWFSLSHAVPAAQARAFLDGLRRRYLGDIAAQRVMLRPSAQGLGHSVDVVPALVGNAGCWSAFVAPDLAAVFADEPWLDLEPSAEAQADLLSRLACIKPEAFSLALERLEAVADAAIAAPSDAQGEAAASPGIFEPGAPRATQVRHTDPRAFLLEVMNNDSIALPLRIEAAKALLPHSGATAPG